MKVKIETEAAARLFNCQVGECRHLEGSTAVPLIASGDVSETTDAAVAKPKAASKAAAMTKAQGAS